MSDSEQNNEPIPELLKTPREKSSTSSPEHPSLIRYRNLGYNILENIDDDLVRDKEILELGSCSECANNILTRPFNAFIILSCEYVFHRLCIKKNLLTKPSRCLFPDCEKNVDIMDPNFTRSKLNDSPSSQSSRTSALSNFMNEKFFLTSPAILEDSIESVENALFQQTE
ncbi:8480_t:CDS:1, partial [Funneliformis geosporum]